MMNEPRLSVTFRFYRDGSLKAIFLNTESEDDQRVLEKALQNLLRADSRISKQLKRCGILGSHTSAPPPSEGPGLITASVMAPVPSDPVLKGEL